MFVLSISLPWEPESYPLRTPLAVGLALALRARWLCGKQQSSEARLIIINFFKPNLKQSCSLAGWRPRRTIGVISWGAEEHGLMGSMEWVEVKDVVLQAIHQPGIHLFSVSNYFFSSGVFHPLENASSDVPERRLICERYVLLCCTCLYILLQFICSFIMYGSLQLEELENIIRSCGQKTGRNGISRTKCFSLGHSSFFIMQICK